MNHSKVECVHSTLLMGVRVLPFRLAFCMANEFAYCGAKRFCMANEFAYCGAKREVDM